MGSYKWGSEYGNHKYNPYQGTYTPTYNYPSTSKYTRTSCLVFGVVGFSTRKLNLASCENLQC